VILATKEYAEVLYIITFFTGENLNSIPKDKLPKCLGRATCPLKMDHKENGVECSLGCSVCRINVLNSL
jgi:hypothetical protein